MLCWQRKPGLSEQSVCDLDVGPGWAQDHLCWRFGVRIGNFRKFAYRWKNTLRFSFNFIKLRLPTAGKRDLHAGVDVTLLVQTRSNFIEKTPDNQETCVQVVQIEHQQLVNFLPSFEVYGLIAN